MDKKIIFIFLLILSINSIIASSIDYQIIENKVLVEINFEIAENLEIKIPYDAKTIEVNTDYELKEIDNHKIIKISFAENLNIKYISESFLDKSGKKIFFIATTPNNLEINLFLPESAILTNPEIVYPSADKIYSDGRRIILKWNNYEDNQIVVAYEFVRDNFSFYLILFLALLFFIFYNSLQKNKFKKEIKKIHEKNIKLKRKKSKIINEGLTKNLFEDEKIIVNYLLGRKNKESWTKEILKDLNISKVKLSRKLRSLEQKEIIKKIPYGNENRIKLLKK